MKRGIFGVFSVLVLVVVLCACGKDAWADTGLPSGDRQGLAAGSDLPADGTWETGIYLRGKQSDLIITGEWDVMTMDVADETVSFEGLEDGDVIRVYTNMVLETWPGQTTVYAVEWEEDGDVRDISPELMEELREMGWLE